MEVCVCHGVFPSAPWAMWIVVQGGLLGAAVGRTRGIWGSRWATPRHLSRRAVPIRAQAGRWCVAVSVCTGVGCRVLKGVHWVARAAVVVDPDPPSPLAVALKGRLGVVLGVRWGAGGSRSGVGVKGGCTSHGNPLPTAIVQEPRVPCSCWAGDPPVFGPGLAVAGQCSRSIQPLARDPPPQSFGALQ